MAGNDPGDAFKNLVGGAVVGIIVLIVLIPKSVWIGLGIVGVVVLLTWIIYKGFCALEVRSEAVKERARVEQVAQAAVTKRQREEALRREKQQLIENIGEKNAQLVQSARTSVQKVRASEAARAGWLGDVDFAADILGITENFRKARALRQVAGELSALDNPSSDDRRILQEARATVESLEKAAVEQVRLIGKCATEAKLVDESLRKERHDARTAEQRAELHAKLSAMLYGIEATPRAPGSDSTAEAVMARVQAYREIKNQIQHIRG